MYPKQITLILIVSLIQINWVVGQSDCTLNDVQSTKGRCTPFRNCSFAIENYKADLPPTRCTGTEVCCPIEETLAEKKCGEWRSYLHEPLAFVDPYPEPRCANTGGGAFITGGRDERKYEFPHAVALGYVHANESTHFGCGGTLISEQHVLTAAHCLAHASMGRPLVALVGDISLKRVTSPVTRALVPIVEWISHPDYKASFGYNDIAVVKLREKVDISRWVLPACLPRPEQTRSRARRNGGDTVQMVGWGTQGGREPASDYLKVVNLTLLKQDECEISRLEMQRMYPEGIKRSQQCVGDKTSNGRGTCESDGGGPLTTKEEYNGRVLDCLITSEGVASSQSPSGTCKDGKPGIYTKVLSYVPWIERVVFAV